MFAVRGSPIVTGASSVSEGICCNMLMASGSSIEMHKGTDVSSASRAKGKAEVNDHFVIFALFDVARRDPRPMGVLRLHCSFLN